MEEKNTYIQRGFNERKTIIDIFYYFLFKLFTNKVMLCLKYGERERSRGRDQYRNGKSKREEGKEIEIDIKEREVYREEKR